MPSFTKAQLNKLAKEYKGLKFDTAPEKYKNRILVLMKFYSLDLIKQLASMDIDFVSDAAKAVLKEKNIEVAFAELANSAIIPTTPDTFHDETPIAPAGVILAQVVEKTRNGDETTTYELASMVNRLAYSELSQEEIAKRFSKAFGDVLIRD